MSPLTLLEITFRCDSKFMYKTAVYTLVNGVITHQKSKYKIVI